MADVELVIKIDEEDYKKVLDLNNHDIGWNIAHTCYEAVLDGTPLPKGHGRLIDADYVLNKMETTNAQPVTSTEYYAWNFCKVMFNKAPTIIEADKEGEKE